MERRAGKLTVTDVVNECNLTRQAFYYYFEDIPDLVRWILESSAGQIAEETLAQGDPEKGLRHLFLLALSVRPYVEHGLQTSYRDEVGRIIEEQFFSLLLQVVERGGLYPQCGYADLRLVVRYHSQAILGLLRSWTEEDGEDLDHIVHVVHQLMAGEISPR